MKPTDEDVKAMVEAYGDGLGFFYERVEDALTENNARLIERLAREAENEALHWSKLASPRPDAVDGALKEKAEQAQKMADWLRDYLGDTQ